MLLADSCTVVGIFFFMFDCVINLLFVWIWKCLATIRVKHCMRMRKQFYVCLVWLPIVQFVSFSRVHVRNEITKHDENECHNINRKLCRHISLLYLECVKICYSARINGWNRFNLLFFSPSPSSQLFVIATFRPFFVFYMVLNDFTCENQ